MEETPDKITLTVHLKPKEVAASFRRHYKNLLNTKKDIALAAVSIGLGYLFGKIAGPALGSVILFAAGIVFFMLPVFMILIYPYLVFSIMSKWREQKDYVFTKEGFSVNSKYYTWSKLEEIVETETAFRFYKSTNDFEIIPKRLFTDLKEQAAFRGMLKQNLIVRE